jgi:hypothetical protein
MLTGNAATVGQGPGRFQVSGVMLPAKFLYKGLGDFAVNYELNVYCDDAQAMSPLYAALSRNILDVFNEYGVQIMTPAYEGDPERVKIVPKKDWFLAPAKASETGARQSASDG